MRLRIREIRKRQGITQAELADRINSTRANIARFETGKHDPQLSTVAKLAEALGVEPAELIDWEGEESPDKEKAAT